MIDKERRDWLRFWASVLTPVVAVFISHEVALARYDERQKERDKQHAEFRTSVNASLDKLDSKVDGLSERVVRIETKLEGG